ncbi:MAG: Ig domain-containing protein [Candidatus Woesearchaeota archaeon]
MKKNLNHIKKYLNNLFLQNSYHLNSMKSHAFNPRKKRMAFIFFIINLLFLILILNNVYSVDFSPVELSPKNATTLDNLICSWNTSLNPKVNVSWYNGSNLYSVVKETTSIQILNNFIARKGETWNCTVVEWNDANNIGSSSITIRNAPPFQPNVVNDTIEEDSTYIRDISTTDPDGDEIISYICIPNTFTINNGIISWTPTSSNVEPEKSKLYNFTCLTLDSEGLSNSKKFSLNVTARNDPPFFNPSLVNISKYENQKIQYIITASDEENPTGKFNLTFDNKICPYDSKTAYELVRINNYTFIFQVINNQTLPYSLVGNCSITLSLYDPMDTNISTNSSINIEVIAINHPPIITNIESKSRNYSQGEYFNLSINATDIDENELINFFVITPTCSFNPWNITILNNSRNASALLKATPLNESHIKCKQIKIRASDTKNAYSEVNLTLNITNVNDPPIIKEISNHINNSFSNINLSNLTAFAYVKFRYYINATDPDIEYGTDPSDSLTFNINSSLCFDCPFISINSNTGEINFTPNLDNIGKTYSYKVNVSDKYGLFDEKILKITILNNSVPYFNQTPPDIYAKEDILYTLKINATDKEDINVSFFLNTTLFNITNTGLINFTPTCQDVGNYSVLITIRDTYGAENSSIMRVYINMSPDLPIIIPIQNTTLFENEAYYLEIIASDDDLLCSQDDNLIFSYNFINGSESSLSDFIFENINNSGNYKALLSFQTILGSQGIYIINFSVVDNYNLKNSYLWELTVINRTNPPVINNITPYGSPYTNYSNGWRPRSNFLGDYTNINISEGMTIIFDHNSTDLDKNTLNFTWLRNNQQIGDKKNLSLFFDYESHGNYNITLIVSDIVNNRIANSVSFSWNISVRNNNRPPILNNSLPNITVNKTISIPNYFTCRDILPGYICDEPRFFDPDNDNLTFTHSNATKVSISINKNSISLTALELGNETITFYASDGTYTIESNPVIINVISLPEQNQQVSQSTSTRTSQSTNYVPYSVLQEVEKEKEIYLDIIVPEQLTIYQNETIRQVINIKNEGNTTLRGIILSASTNSSSADLSFSNSFISELKPNEIVKTDLIIKDYKLKNNYEIIIWANVTEPNYRDKAIIYVNAIEKTRGNQSITATKITFAQDLLSSNPECIELNEYLKKSLNYMEAKNYEEAEKIIDSVIQGCKYLVSQSKLKEESPKGLLLNLKITNPYIRGAIILTILAIITIVAMTIKLKKSNNEENNL